MKAHKYLFAVFSIFIIAFILLSSKSNNKSKFDIKNIKFGTLFTDHIFIMEWDETNKWHNARIEKFKDFKFDPALIYLHYGGQVFEGMKAYRTNDGNIQLFRPMENLNRLNHSAKRMAMPEINKEFVLEQLKKLVKLDKNWIPSEPLTSLYIRPVMLSTEVTINLRPANKFLFYIIMSPVGAFHDEGFGPISILVSQKYSRACSGGVGDVKTAGNYAAAMIAKKEARNEGLTDVLWLDPNERKYVEEVGSMNIFFVINDEVITPKLTGLILPGITRKSIIALGKYMNLKMVERNITIDEVIKAIKDGSCKEIFGSGTAAIISPIGRLKYADEIYTINNNKIGPISQKLLDALTGIQYGSQKDIFDWTVKIN